MSVPWGSVGGDPAFLRPPSHYSPLSTRWGLAGGDPTFFSDLFQPGSSTGGGREVSVVCFQIARRHLRLASDSVFDLCCRRAVTTVSGDAGHEFSGGGFLPEPGITSSPHRVRVEDIWGDAMSSSFGVITWRGCEDLFHPSYI